MLFRSQFPRTNVRLVGTDADDTGRRVALSVPGGRKVDFTAVADAAVFGRIGVAGQTGYLAYTAGIVRAVAALAVAHVPAVGADRLAVEAVLYRWIDPALGMNAGRRSTGHCGIVSNFTAGAEPQQYQGEKAGDEQIACAPFASEYTLHGALFFHLLP